MKRTPEINLYNEDNIEFLRNTDNKYDLIYSDVIYENKNMDWVYSAISCLREDGIFIIQTDYHTVAEYKILLDSFNELNFVNWIVWKNEWGNFRKDRFHQCHDDILIYCKGDHIFYPGRIQVKKATAGTNLNPSGRETKTATAWVDDITLTTTSKERVKKDDGHLVRWQKPLALYDRIFLPFTDESWHILDLFAGVGSVAQWCRLNNRDYTGIEIDKETYSLAVDRILYGFI